jgi:hypothetical protein
MRTASHSGYDGCLLGYVTYVTKSIIGLLIWRGFLFRRMLYWRVTGGVPGMRRRDRVLFIDNLQGWIVTVHSNVTLKVTILAKISLREREGAL